MSLEKRNELAKKVIELLLAEGAAMDMAEGTVEQSADKMQMYVQALTIVAAKVITSHLLKEIQEGMDPDAVSANADTIVGQSQQHLDDCVFHSLASAVQYMETLIDQQDKGKLSH